MPDADVVVQQLDLADLVSVKACADAILANEARIDFLILNAGVMACPKVLTSESWPVRTTGVTACSPRQRSTRSPSRCRAPSHYQ